MHTIIKLAISLAVILLCTLLSKKLPSLAGLIAVMPLTGALVLIWTYLENSGNQRVMTKFTNGALWGIVPSICFFLVAFFCFRKQLPLPLTLLLSFSAWALGALVHQRLLGQ